MPYSLKVAWQQPEDEDKPNTIKWNMWVAAYDSEGNVEAYRQDTVSLDAIMVGLPQVLLHHQLLQNVNKGVKMLCAESRPLKTGVNNLCPKHSLCFYKLCFGTISEAQGGKTLSLAN